MPAKKLATSATAFLSQWRGSASFHQSYNALASNVEREMKIHEQLEKCDEIALAEVQTFEAVERQMVRLLRDQRRCKERLFVPRI